MAGLVPKDGSDPGNSARSLLLTTAIVTLACTAANMRPAYSQSVTGNGVNPGPVQTPNWFVGGDLEIGNSNPGGGTLTIENGGTVTNDTGFIGYGATDEGTVTVSAQDGNGNASTWTNNGDLVVGQDGTGTLHIEDGGVVINASGYVGAGAGSQGHVTVSGHDGSGNASTWTSTDTVYIGDYGTASLTILDGGVVNSGWASIGENTSGTGTVTVSGRDINGNASSWNVTNQILIGNSGVNNTLDVLAGGAVNSEQGLIAFTSGSEGTVTVSGRDVNGNASTWNAVNNIYVGFAGDGTLSVQDGAAVATSAAGGGAASIYIGYMSGSTGTVDVSSTTGDVSSLTATDSINVGDSGTGTMTVGKGGFVSVGGNVRIANGNTSSGTLHLNGDSTGRGVVATGSVIHGLGTTAILDLNGGILRATRDTANFLNGFDTLSIGAEGAWFDSNARDIAIGTDFSGTSSLNKLGLGQLTLTGDSSGFTGAATVSAGTLAVNGVLGGTMTVDPAGRLVGTGQVGNTTNRGIVAPGYGNAMGALTVQGTYVSAGGRLEIATALGDDSSPTSRLVVNGATSGVTQVEVINRSGLGGQTVEGIKIIDVTGASNGTFVLDGSYVFKGEQAVIAGAYAYRLYQGGVSSPADGDWYLRSALLETGDPTPPPLYQPGVPIYEAYAANLQSLNTLPTLQQRVGNHSWADSANRGGSGIWGRTEGTRTRAKAAASTSGSDQSVDSLKTQLGADWLLADPDKGERLVAGITVNYGEAISQIRSIFGNGTLKTEGYGVGATLTWYGVDGFYVDGQAQISHFSSDLGSDFLGTLTEDNSGHGAAFSIEAGKRMPIGGKLSITPQIQTAYSNVHFDRFVDALGASVSTGKGDSLKTRWGITLDHQSAWENGRSHIYALVNLNYEWLDGTRALVSDTQIDRADERLWGELGLGASVNWRENITLYSEVAANTPFRDFGNSYDLKGSVGLQLQF
jgi:outer membrane autotransporter protein